MDPTARFSVLDSRPGVAVRFQPRPGGLLELVHHPVYLGASQKTEKIVRQATGSGP